jgi:hypothetical protein
MSGACSTHVEKRNECKILVVIAYLKGSDLLECLGIGGRVWTHDIEPPVSIKGGKFIDRPLKDSVSRIIMWFEQLRLDTNLFTK